MHLFDVFTLKHTQNKEMKNVLILPIVLLCFNLALAQENDSTRTEEKPVPMDTIPPVKEEPKVEPKSTPSDTIPTPKEQPRVESEEAPRIIYYQSTDDEPRRRDRRRDIKTLSGSMSHSGGFGALSFRSSDFNGESLVMAGLRGGWIINRTLGIGFEGHGVIPTTKFENIEANQEVNLLGGYGGMFLELIFFSNEVVHITFPVSGGAGWLGYDRTNDNTAIPMPNADGRVDSDVFWYVEPGADLEVNVSRNFRLAMGVSKRFTQDFELVNTEQDAFEKLNYFITLKVGGF